jgi:hypothetical protein
MIEKLQVAFEKLDLYYLELYDKQKQFNKKTTAENKRELEKSLRLFRKHFNSYDRLVSNLWINEKWGGD